MREQYLHAADRSGGDACGDPACCRPTQETRRGAFIVLCHVLNARGDVTGEAADRLRQVAQLFGVEADPSVLLEPEGGDRKARA